MDPVADVRPGILLVDKPLGPTSHDLVQRTRRLAGTRRVGHAGTLDPQASGLMMLGIGAATRLLTYLVGLDKTYFATIRLGFETTTDDAAGAPLGPSVDVPHAVLNRIPQALQTLTGDIDQVPSAVSAIHVNGRRAHELVRAGETVDLPARRVHIGRLEVLEMRGTEIDIVVDCTSGTYVRAIARDLGRALGVGGHITALRRTRVGPFRVEDAPAFEAPLALLAPAAVAAALFPTVSLDAEQTRDLGQGKRVAVPGRADAAIAAAIAPSGSLIGLASIEGGALRTLMNFPVMADEPSPPDTAVQAQTEPSRA